MLGFLKKEENDLNERSLLFELWSTIKVGSKSLIQISNLKTFLLGVLNIQFDWMMSNEKENSEDSFKFRNEHHI